MATIEEFTGEQALEVSHCHLNANRQAKLLNHGIDLKQAIMVVLSDVLLLCTACGHTQGLQIWVNELELAKVDLQEGKDGEPAAERL